MRFSKLIGASLGALAATTLAAAPAHAAEGPSHVGLQATQMTCAGQPVTLLVAPGNGGDNWGAATVVDAGTLIPKTLEYFVHDDTTGATLDDEVISRGRAHAQQSTITCETSQSDVLGDVLPPDMELPPGTAATDTVTSTFRVVAVPRP